MSVELGGGRDRRKSMFSLLGHLCRFSASAEWSKNSATENWTISVKVSAHQLNLSDLNSKLENILRHSGARATHLKLELNESVMMEKAENTVSKMWQLKALGITFSMDDFGTGYSSLSYLKRLPLNQLKIDRSFVSDIQTESSDAAIARTVVALGESLGMAVIAEGVETEAERSLLNDMGCRYYQGYLFGRPFPIAELETWHAAHMARYLQRTINA